MAEHLGPPEVEPGEEPEQCTTEDHVVEVGDDVVGIGLLGVDRRQGVGDAREATDREHRHDAGGEEHRRVETQLATPHGGHPVQDLHAGRDGDEHRRKRERAHRDRPDARHEHVVCPDAPAHEADGDP